MKQSKTIIITGANGNLGQAVTARMLQDENHVIALLRNREAAKLLPQHPLLELVITDLADEQAIADMIQSVVERHASIDAVLLLAGGFAMGNFTSTGAVAIHDQLDMNFFTAYTVAQQAFIQMKNQGHGELIFIGAKPALEPHAGKSALAYALSKSLLFKLADFINDEAKGSAVKATVLVPGILDTEANRQAMPAADPANWVSVSDLAGIIAFLLSNEAGPLRQTVLKVYANS